MSERKRGDEAIWRCCQADGPRASWRRVGELVRCEGCVNWGAMGDFYHLPDYCPVVRKCTRPGDWCCWGARKGESDER